MNHLVSIGVYSVYDRVAELYGTPFTFAGEKRDDLACRAFNEARADKSSPIGRSPDDFKLFKIAWIDLGSGQVHDRDSERVYPFQLV